MTSLGNRGVELGERVEMKLNSGEGLGGQRGGVVLTPGSSVKEIGSERPPYMVEVLRQMTCVVDLLRTTEFRQFRTIAPSLLPKRDRAYVEQLAISGAVAKIFVYLTYADGMRIDGWAEFEKGVPVLRRLELAWFSRETESSVVELDSRWVAALLSASALQAKELALRVCNEVLVLRQLPSEVYRRDSRDDRWTPNV